MSFFIAVLFRIKNFSESSTHSFKFEKVDSCLWRMYKAYFLALIRNGFIISQRNFYYLKDISM